MIGKTLTLSFCGFFASSDPVETEADKLLGVLDFASCSCFGISVHQFLITNVTGKTLTFSSSGFLAISDPVGTKGDKLLGVSKAFCLPFHFFTRDRSELRIVLGI